MRRDSGPTQRTTTSTVKPRRSKVKSWKRSPRDRGIELAPHERASQRLPGFLTERCFALFCWCFDGFLLPAARRALDRTGTCFLDTGNFVCAPSGTMKRIAKARSFLSMLE